MTKFVVLQATVVALAIAAAAPAMAASAHNLQTGAHNKNPHSMHMMMKRPRHHMRRHMMK